MSKSKTVSFADLPADKLIEICDALESDGHTIWKTDVLTRLDVPQEYVESVTHTYESDGSYKGSIFSTTDGSVQDSMTGIYGLTVYRRIGRDLGLPGSQMGGRGFEARDWDRRIRAHLATV